MDLLLERFRTPGAKVFLSRENGEKISIDLSLDKADNLNIVIPDNVYYISVDFWASLLSDYSKRDDFPFNLTVENKGNCPYEKKYKEAIDILIKTKENKFVLDVTDEHRRAGSDIFLVKISFIDYIRFIKKEIEYLKLTNGNYYNEEGAKYTLYEAIKGYKLIVLNRDKLKKMIKEDEEELLKTPLHDRAEYDLYNKRSDILKKLIEETSDKYLLKQFKKNLKKLKGKYFKESFHGNIIKVRQDSIVYEEKINKIFEKYPIYYKEFIELFKVSEFKEVFKKEFDNIYNQVISEDI